MAPQPVPKRAIEDADDARDLHRLRLTVVLSQYRAYWFGRPGTSQAISKVAECPSFRRLERFSSRSLPPRATEVGSKLGSDHPDSFSTLVALPRDPPATTWDATRRPSGCPSPTAPKGAKRPPTVRPALLNPAPRRLSPQRFPRPHAGPRIAAPRSSFEPSLAIRVFPFNGSWCPIPAVRKESAGPNSFGRGAGDFRSCNEAASVPIPKFASI
jgi:hypothetical protein